MQLKGLKRFVSSEGLSNGRRSVHAGVSFQIVIQAAAHRTIMKAGTRIETKYFLEYSVQKLLWGGMCPVPASVANEEIPGDRV